MVRRGLQGVSFWLVDHGNKRGRATSDPAQPILQINFELIVKRVKG